MTFWIGWSGALRCVESLRLSLIGNELTTSIQRSALRSFR